MLGVGWGETNSMEIETFTWRAELDHGTPHVPNQEVSQGRSLRDLSPRGSHTRLGKVQGHSTTRSWRSVCVMTQCSLASEALGTRHINMVESFFFSRHLRFWEFSISVSPLNLSLLVGHLFAF